MTITQTVRRTLLGAAIAVGLAGPASAALPVGAKAPPLVTEGALGGKAFRFNLAAALKKGPVVLYFYPKAFTKGCTLEARAFSEKRAEFRNAGAQIVGMSADDLATLKRFSVEECRNAFAVASASRATIKAYDVAMPVANKVSTMSNRTSYVIAPNGKIVMVHSDLDWSEHVDKTLAAVKALKRK